MVLRETGFARNWFCETGSVQNWNCESGSVRKRFCGKSKSSSAKLVLHIIGATKVVLCKKGSVGNWFNDSIDE